MSDFRAPLPRMARPRGPPPSAPAPPRITERVSWEYPTPAPPAPSISLDLPAPSNPFSAPLMPPPPGLNLNLPHPAASLNAAPVSALHSSAPFVPAFPDDRDFSAPPPSFSTFASTALPLLNADSPSSRPPRRNTSYRPPSPPKLSIMNTTPWRSFNQVQISPPLQAMAPRRRSRSRTRSRSRSGSPLARRRRRYSSSSPSPDTSGLPEPHNIRLRTVRNILFSLADDSVDEEYLDIFLARLNENVVAATRFRSCVVVVVGAQISHFNTVVQNIKRSHQDTVSLSDHAYDTWESLSVRYDWRDRWDSRDPSRASVVVVNGFIPPPEGAVINSVMGFGVPIVGRPDARRLMTSWCDYLDVIRTKYKVNAKEGLWLDLWVETGCGPELAGMVDFADSLEGKRRARFEMMSRVRDLARRERGSSERDARSRSRERRSGGGRDKRRSSERSRRSSPGHRRRTSSSPTGGQRRMRRRRSGSPFGSSSRQVTTERRDSFTITANFAQREALSLGKHPMVFVKIPYRMFQQGLFINDKLSHRLLVGIQKDLERKSASKGRQLVIVVIGRLTRETLNSLVEKLQGRMGRDKVLGILDEDGNNWELREAIQVPDEVEVVVMNGLIPVKNRVVVGVHAMGLPERDSEDGYVSHMLNWCEFLDAMLPAEAGKRTRKRGSLWVTMWLSVIAMLTRTDVLMLSGIRKWYNSGGDINVAGLLPRFIRSWEEDVDDNDLRQVLDYKNDNRSSSSKGGGQHRRDWLQGDDGKSRFVRATAEMKRRREAQDADKGALHTKDGVDSP